MATNHAVIVPLLFALITILVALLSRRNDDGSPMINDFYVGRSVSLGALSAATVYLVRAVVQSRTEASLFCIFQLLALLLMVLLVAAWDRFVAWECVAGVHRRKVVVGLVAPNIVAVVVFVTVFFFAKKHGL